MTLPLLAPRFSEAAVPAALDYSLLPTRTYTQSEWAAVYPDIERLYVQERRKLRYIMRYMEEHHGFSATEQMYKKRLAKWGLSKNTRRSGTALSASANSGRHKRGLSRDLRPLPTAAAIPAVPVASNIDKLVGILLVSLRTWSHSFFEDAQSKRQIPQVRDMRMPEYGLDLQDAKEMSYALKLVTNLLARGHGNLAGRVARKAFMLVERMLQLEGPALAWNLLEMMYNLVKAREMQLLKMLLAYLVGLTHNRLPKTHPLPAILRSLNALVIPLADVKCLPGSFPPRSTSTPSTSAPDNKQPRAIEVPSEDPMTLLHRAWTLNATELFDHFHPSLIYLYYRMNWDSCILDLTIGVSDSAKNWFQTRNGVEQVFNGEDAISNSESEAYSEAADSYEQHKTLTPRNGSFAMERFRVLRNSSIKALRESCDDNAPNAKTPNCKHSGAHSPHILALLVSAEVFETEQHHIARTLDAVKGLTEVPRIQAAHTACMMKTLMLLGIDQDKDLYGSAQMTTIERMRAIVSLQEYAHGETDPQVVRDMWALLDVLSTSGEHVEAQKVRQEIFRRLDKYVEAVPPDGI